MIDIERSIHRKRLQQTCCCSQAAYRNSAAQNRESAVRAVRVQGGSAVVQERVGGSKRHCRGLSRHVCCGRKFAPGHTGCSSLEALPV